MTPQPYDSILIVSFGGPEKPEDVIPFLENVLRGRNVPRERLLKVAEHYYHFGGKSPINAHNRQLIAGLEDQLRRHGPALPVYWGNRNWHPFLPDTVRRMRDEGKRRAVAFVTSAFSSYSGCRQYLENIARAQEQVGPGAPEIHKTRVFYNHPLFIQAMAANVRAAYGELPAASRETALLIFTAHSVPQAMADSSSYVRQLEEASRLVAEQAGRSEWRLAYQSRSGPPSQPWLEPDVQDLVRGLNPAQRASGLVVAPIGFLSDHIEVLYDLDTELKAVARQNGIAMARAATVGGSSEFPTLVRELILERLGMCEPRAIGRFGPASSECDVTCCPAPLRLVR